MPFKRQENVFDGKVCVEPRLSCWYGEHSYSYNPLLKHEATAIDKWPSILKQILSQIKTDPNVKQLFPSINLNSVLCNLYRNGLTNDFIIAVYCQKRFYGPINRTCKDKMGWHGDNEPELGPQPVIVSLSFGEKRRFQLKRKTAEEDLPEYQMTLFPGSLMIMYGRLQDDWRHRVPAEYHDRDERINLTFRYVHPR